MRQQGRVTGELLRGDWDVAENVNRPKPGKPKACDFVPWSRVKKVWQPKEPQPIDVHLGPRPCPCCRRKVFPLQFSLVDPGELPRNDGHCRRCFDQHLRGKDVVKDSTRDGEDERTLKTRQGSLLPTEREAS